jgi:hypothetical protein
MEIKELFSDKVRMRGRGQNTLINFVFRLHFVRVKGEKERKNARRIYLSDILMPCENCISVDTHIHTHTHSLSLSLILQLLINMNFSLGVPLILSVIRSKAVPLGGKWKMLCPTLNLFLSSLSIILILIKKWRSVLVIVTFCLSN